MSETKPYEEHGSAQESRYTDLLRTLTVERFTLWKPSTLAEERDEMPTSRTLRDRLPFEPITPTF